MSSEAVSGEGAPARPAGAARRRKSPPVPAVDPILQLRGVRRTYRTGEGDLEVLKGCDLDVYPGEIVGLIGPSGSGKSSLLHAAGLLERPTGGRIVIEGRDCSALTEGERTRIRLSAIGFVYQFHHLLAEFSALDNVALPQMIAGLPRTTARKRATELLNYLGLSARLEHQPGQLSGGEQQRVAIARALANAPRLLLADEPTGNLDPTTSAAVFKTMFDLSRAAGVALLVATHNMELARHMDRVFALQDGHLEPQTLA
jgi:lipoprotein-releasing system ATP-binding protein